MQFIKINGVTLHYSWQPGQNDRPVVVFSNSLGTDFRIWSEVIGQLNGEYSILVYDKRGHGLSDLAQPPYKMDDHIGDLVGLLEHLEIGKSVICGLSVGGMIAQGLFARRPDLVRALILCDTAHRIGTLEMWQERISAIHEDGLEAMAEAILERWFTAAFRAAEDGALNIYKNMLIRTPVEGYLGVCAALRDTDFSEQAAKINVPTLCIVGDEDGATPPQLVKELAGIVPGAQYKVIANAGHLPCIEQPWAFSTIIREFMDHKNRLAEGRIVAA